MPRLIHISVLLLMVLFTGCSKFTKATDLITNPSAKERYQRDFNISDDLFMIWKRQVDFALNDSVKINLPYLQAGHFKPRNFPVISYNLDLKTGERLEVFVEMDSISDLVFIELYRQQNDSLRTFEKVSDSGFEKKQLTREIEKTGTYKLIIQPEIEASTPFRIKINSRPIYSFPVAGGINKNIQSFWGATRDGGRRSHEGVDIFASRGTPVLAVVDGRISSSGEKGLGGKQVWLRDPKRGQSLYYAHLDSIEPLGNVRVRRGDTIGYVGNTGNARTTAPHLHFGIYKGYRGAIDPLPHIYQADEPIFQMPEKLPETVSLVTTGRANLRDLPAVTHSRIIGNSPAQDTLRSLGKTKDWFHIRTSDHQAAFIHESLVAPL